MTRFETIGELDNSADAEHFSRFLMDEVGVESGVAQYTAGSAVWVVAEGAELAECRRLFAETFRVHGAVLGMIASHVESNGNAAPGQLS